MRTTDGSPVLAIGPANHAGQAYAWSRAVSRNLPAKAWAFSHQASRSQPLVFAADKLIGRWSYRNPLAREFRTVRLFRGVTHVALDGYAPFFHLRRAGRIGQDVRRLAAQGFGVALIAHGSDVRNPDLHLSLDRWSYFNEGSAEWLDSLRSSAAANRAAADASGLPLFCSTPDLVNDLPTATWLPVCVEPAHWRTDAPLLERAVPRVLHVPSNSLVKGSRYVDPALTALAERGAIEYVAPRAIPPSQMRALVQSCDVVVDQLLAGSYGVAAVEAMAAGRVVIGRLRPDVKAKMPEAPQIVDATPADITEIVLSVLERRQELRAVAEDNLAFVNRWHDGAESARRLRPFLGLEGG